MRPHAYAHAYTTCGLASKAHRVDFRPIHVSCIARRRTVPDDHIILTVTGVWHIMHGSLEARKKHARMAVCGDMPFLAAHCNRLQLHIPV